MYYFAYGSNMDAEDFAGWCDENNKTMPAFNDGRVGLLNDFKLVIIILNPENLVQQILLKQKASRYMG